jgi:hypothetical protein
MDILVAIYGFICFAIGAAVIHTKNVGIEFSRESRCAAGKPVVAVGAAITLAGIAIIAWGLSNIFLDLPKIFRIA